MWERVCECVTHHRRDLKFATSEAKKNCTYFVVEQTRIIKPRERERERREAATNLSLSTDAKKTCWGTLTELRLIFKQTLRKDKAWKFFFFFSKQKKEKQKNAQIEMQKAKYLARFFLTQFNEFVLHICWELMLLQHQNTITNLHKAKKKLKYEFKWFQVILITMIQPKW